MASAGGREVGRVSIRVVPDLDGFRKQLVRELKAIQRSVSVKIPVELDMKTATTQIARLRNQLGSMKGAKIDLGLNDSVETSVKNITTHAKTLRGVLTSIPGIAGKIASPFQNIGKSVTGAAKNVVKFRDEIRTIRDINLDSSGTSKFFKDMSSGKFLDTKPLNKFRNELTSMNSVFKGFGKLGVNTLKNVGKGALDMDLSFRRSVKTAKLFGTTVTKGLGVAGSALKGIAGMATLGASGFGQLSRFAKIFVAVIAAAPAILGVISGLLAGLPSLLAAVGVGALVVGLGLDGIKKSFDAFKEGLAPLQASISSVFEKGLTPQFAAISKVLYSLEPGLKAVASGLLEMSGGFVDAITSAQGLKNVNTLVNNTATFFKELGPFVENFTSGFLTMAAEGSKHFGLLTGVLNNFATKWKEMSERIAGNGVLRGALEGLAKVTDALLQGFLKLMESGLGAMMELGGPLANALSSVVDVLVALMPILTAFSGVILTVISSVGQALIPIFNVLTPIIQQIAQIVANALLPVIQALAPGITALATFAGDLFIALSPLFPILAKVAEVLSTVLVSALNALRPVLPVISDAMAKVAEVVNTALASATPILSEIASTLGGVLAKAIETVAPMLPGLIESFLKLLEAILPLLPPILELVGTALPPMLELIMKLLPPILDLATGIINTLMPALEWLIGIITDVIGWFGNLLDGIGDVAVGVINFFKDLPGKIWEWVKNAGTWLFQTGKDILQGLWNGLIDIWNGIVRWFEDRARDIANFFKSALGINSPSTVMIAIGQDTMRGLQIGLQDVAPDALTTVKDVADEIATIGSNMSADVTADGGLELYGAGFKDEIISALEGWSVQQDRQGTFNLNRAATRDNAYGR